MRPATSSPPHLIVFSTPPPSVSCLLLPVFLLSCLPHISLNIVLPYQHWPPISPPHVTLSLSSVVCHPPSFQRVLPTVVCSSLVYLSSSSAALLSLPFNSTILLLSALVTLAIFRTQLFSHTCSLCCCSSVIAKVSVPYRHARCHM